MFCEIDYRPCEDIVSRRIQEVIVIAQVKGVSMKELWRVFDKDGSGAIDRQEFNEIMWKIEPNMPEGDVGMVWERFDANRSGHI
jgi:Ca2+-binding EF-hand superfamily protein